MRVHLYLLCLIRPYIVGSFLKAVVHDASFMFSHE